MRISEKDLRNLIERLNKLTDSPLTSYTRNETGNHANVGNYHLGAAYGGYILQRMSNTGGGVVNVLGCGYVPKKDLYNRMSAYIRGVETCNC